MTLNGYDLEEAKILHLGGKPLNAPEGQCVLMVCVDHRMWEFSYN